MHKLIKAGFSVLYGHFLFEAGFAHSNLSAVKVVFCPLSACYQQKAK